MIFDNSLNASKARSKDILELFPTWRVGIALDKGYRQLYGIQVSIWVDTKEVRSAQKAWSTVPPPEGAPTANMNVTGEVASQHAATAEFDDITVVTQGSY